MLLGQSPHCQFYLLSKQKQVEWGGLFRPRGQTAAALQPINSMSPFENFPLFGISYRAVGLVVPETLARGQGCVWRALDSYPGPASYSLCDLE